MEMLNKQAKELKTMLKQSLEHARAAETKPKGGGSAGPAEDLPNVKLPPRIGDWRTLHVKAWLAFRLELPQYADAFMEASVDGLVLLHHVNDETLIKQLKVLPPMHRLKILDGVKELRDRQARVDSERELKLQELAKQRQAMLDARRQKEDEERRERMRKEKNSQKSTERKKSAKKRRPPKVVVTTAAPVEVREQNAVERVRVEREMRKLHDKQRSVARALDHHEQRIWPFEYTGDASSLTAVSRLPGSHHTVWDHMAAEEKKDESHGSEAYQQTMADILLTSDQELLGTSVSPKKPRVTTLPATASFEEIVAAIRGAMFELSERLWKVHHLRAVRERVSDSDIDGWWATATRHSLEDDDRPPTYDQTMRGEAEDVEALEEPSVEEILPTIAPPPYEEITALTAPPSVPPPPLAKQAPEPPPTRLKLVFDEFVNQKNNGAKWLGANNKLTRLKLSGGLVSLLRLELSWAQFDMLWTVMDNQRTGEIDFQEFHRFFGDLENFESSMNAVGLSVTRTASAGVGGGSTGILADLSMEELTKTLYQVCDTLRYAGFSITEMFASFDRNGSGQVSVSEFCSMLRVLVGHGFNKRVIYRALLVMDSDGNKSIELVELMKFVYNVWRVQLDELSAKLQAVSPDTLRSPDAKVKAFIQERQSIVDALKRNFSREMRNALEKAIVYHPETDLALIPGPFASILVHTHGGRRRGAASPLRTSASAAWEGAEKAVTLPMSRPASSPSNELLRYRLSNATTTLPTRVGTKLRLPVVKDLNQTPFASPGGIMAVLKNT